MNDRQFRQHLAELLAKQRSPDRPAKKNLPTPEPTPNAAIMSNKEFRQHIKVLLARQRNDDQQPAEKQPTTISMISNPPSPESRKKPPAKEQRPTTETRKFNVRTKAK